VSKGKVAGLKELCGMEISRQSTLGMKFTHSQIFIESLLSAEHRDEEMK
jgi:hypothetical protein